ncbi:MAG: hypothetical protein AAF515_19800 [Pseudomonadota bacterium]
MPRYVALAALGTALAAASLFAVGRGGLPSLRPAAPVAAPQPEPAPFIKWNPGHYAMASADLPLKKIERYWSRHPFCTDPRGAKYIEGVRLKFHWRALEPKKGQYDWRIIDEYLRVMTQSCGDRPRRVMLAVDHQANNRDANKESKRMCAPEYIWKMDGVWHFTRRTGKERCLARIWRPGVAEHYKNLAVAMARRYNDHPLVEYFSTKGEGSLGLPEERGDFERARYTQALLDVAAAMRAHAPNTAFTFGSNHFGRDKENFMPFVTAANSLPGFGWRWPDTFHTPDKPFPATATHEYYKSFSGVHGPLAGEHQLPKRRGRKTSGYDNAWLHCCDPASEQRGVHPQTGKVVDVTWAATHPVWPRRDYDDKFNVENLLTVLAERDGGVYSRACPQAWTRHGVTCLTGGLPDATTPIASAPEVRSKRERKRARKERVQRGEQQGQQRRDQQRL